MDKLVDAIVTAYKDGNKILIAGNGGLASDSEHFAAELMGKFAFDVYLPCISLTANSAIMTAIPNDMGFDRVFSHQVSILGKTGDIFIGMTTSHSANVGRALKVARKKGLITVVICSEKDTNFRYADYIFSMSGNDTAEIQNETIQYLHKLAYEIKRRLVCQ